MNNIKSFSFYRNYYELLKYLPNEERLKLYDAMLEYIFEDKEPKLENLAKGIWINLKMPLETSKNNAGRGGRPAKKETEEKTNKKPIKNRKETEVITEKKTNNISIFLFLISNNKYKYIIINSNIYKIIYEWLEYKEQRKEKYTEIGLKNLLTQIEKQIEINGEEEVVNLIEECMSNNYKGIIFDKLKNKNKKEKNIPKWFEEKNKINETTIEDDITFDELLKGIESE